MVELMITEKIKFTNEENNFYIENGYLIIKNVIPEKICDNYLKQIRKHADNNFAAIMNPDRFEYLVAQSFENMIFGFCHFCGGSKLYIADSAYFYMVHIKDLLEMKRTLLISIFSLIKFLIHHQIFS